VRGDGSEGAGRTSGITLIDADGSNERPLTTTGHHAYSPNEIPIQWSSRGDIIAYGRPCGACRDGQDIEIVLVTAADDPAHPIGTETILAPPVTETPSGPMEWYATSFSWSPDGTRLLYESPETADRRGGVLIVPIGSDQQPQELTGGTFANPWGTPFPYLPNQQWGRW
jgi:Tol biopolymer transport system component